MVAKAGPEGEVVLFHHLNFSVCFARRPLSRPKFRKPRRGSAVHPCPKPPSRGGHSSCWRVGRGEVEPPAPQEPKLQQRSRQYKAGGPGPPAPPAPSTALQQPGRLGPRPGGGEGRKGRTGRSCSPSRSPFPARPRPAASSPKPRPPGLCLSFPLREALEVSGGAGWAAHR